MIIRTQQLFFVIMCTITISNFCAENSQSKNQTGTLQITTKLCDDNYTVQVKPEGSPISEYFLSKETRDIPVNFENNSTVLWIRCNSKAAILQVGSDVTHLTVTQDNNKKLTLTTNTGQELPL